MSHPLMPPGAWLSGDLRADLRPIGPPGSRHRPIGPPGSGNRPIGPPGSGNRPIGPPGAPWALQAGADDPEAPRWDGVDPAWTYADDDTLLAQALRKSRAKVVQAGDDRLTPDVVAEAASQGRAVRGSHLWRWDAQFRVETVLCELAGRFMQAGTTVWHLDPQVPGAGGAPQFTPAAVITLPAAVDYPVDQVDKVLRAAVEREDRLPEILSQAADFWPFFESVVQLRLASAPRLAELLQVAQMWAQQVLMGLKHAVAARRPAQYSTLVQPVIPTPGHGALPSGHATVAALYAELLSGLLYGTGPLAAERRNVLDRLARRVAFNRVVAGVHFPVDNLVGYALGTQLARVFVALASGGALPATVDEAAMCLLDPSSDAAGNASLLADPGRGLPEGDGARLPAVAGAVVQAAPLLRELWLRTAQELHDLRV